MNSAQQESAQEVYIASGNSLQLRTIAESLTRKLNLNCQFVDLNIACKRTKVLLIDCLFYNADEITLILSCSHDDDAISKIVLINALDDTQHSDYCRSPNLAGIFYVGTSITEIVKGFEKILLGELWIPRRIMQQLIQRKPIKTLNPVIESLTRRERQVLGQLECGASNQAIARTLFVSEHTVKSHLYNVFKKIGTNNRMQASNWAKQHLTSETTPRRAMH